LAASGQITATGTLDGIVVPIRIVRSQFEENHDGNQRAKAAAKNVDVSTKSSGGSRPTEELRPVTSGDIIEMSKRAAAVRAETA
jgi:hypothetical protein